MKYIECVDRNQLILYPEKLDDLVGEENPVREIDAFVEMPDLSGLGFKKAELDPTSAGAPCYAPCSLTKLYIYGYMNKVRSSRKLEGACVSDINAMWLMSGVRPDHWTISNFRKENAAAVKQVFKAFVRMSIELWLYKTDVGVQDGIKFSANNSKDNNVTVPKLEKKIEIAEEKIGKYFTELDKIDKEEGNQEYIK
jgi:transposase